MRRLLGLIVILFPLASFGAGASYRTALKVANSRAGLGAVMKHNQSSNRPLEIVLTEKGKRVKTRLEGMYFGDTHLGHVVVLSDRRRVQRHFEITKDGEVKLQVTRKDYKNKGILFTTPHDTDYLPPNGGGRRVQKRGADGRFGAMDRKFAGLE